MKVAGGLTVAALGLGCAENGETTTPTTTPTAAPTETQTPEAIPDLPWPYEKLDVEETRKLGHLGYHKGLHCAAGTFYAIVSQLKEKVGYPYTQIPMDMVYYGAGGVAGWASLCGTINGGSCAINLVAGPEEQGALVNELVGYYTTAEFPTNESNQLAQNGAFLADDYIDDSIEQSVSGSTLCHVSVTRWCVKTGHASGDPIRSERCARVAGDMAAKVVEILNAWKDGTFEPQFELSSETQGCKSCHSSGTNFEKGEFTRGKMQCANCHESHPVPPESNRIRSVLNQTKTQ